MKLKVATRIYSGLRYRFGLPCRGQRTRSNSRTIGYLCKAKVRKNVNYSAQKKKKQDIFLTNGGVSGQDVESKGSGRKDTILQTQVYDTMFAEKISFLTSITSFRHAFTRNQLITLNKEFLKNFKNKKGDSFQ